MKRILCYGDSNTWGLIPGSNFKRFGENKRWTKLLQKNLGNDYLVIEEGMPGRTCGTTSILAPLGDRNGSLNFAQTYFSQAEIDIVILMIGTNDMQQEFNKTAKDNTAALQKFYIDIVKSRINDMVDKIPEIIIVPPAIMNVPPSEKWNGANEKSLLFDEEYKKLAKNNGCYFVSNQGLIVGADGFHLTEKSHKLLAEKLTKVIKSMKEV